MTSSKIEFGVQMTCQKCVKAITSALSGVEGIEKFEISLDNESVIVQTSLPANIIQEKIESTGRRTVLKGYGNNTADGVQGSAVAMLGGYTGYSWGEIKGVVRLVQVNNDECVIDGTIDGLAPGSRPSLYVFERGDLSNGCENLGSQFCLNATNHGSQNDEKQHRHTGDLGNVLANESGRASFRIVDKVLKVWDVIGRSLVVTDGKNIESLQNGNTCKRLACGIISRSSGLNENPKQICACDGVSIWDERS